MVASGALTQLAAKGPQDRWLTCESIITFWKGGYRRHTNFAMAEIEQTFNNGGPANFLGQRKLTATINRSGDLISYIYLHVELGPVRYDDVGGEIYDPPDNFAHWTNSVGHAIINEVKVEIGGHEFDSQTGEYMEIWETLSAPAAKRLREMTGFAETVTQLGQFAARRQFLYVPLRFWFNRFYEQALPLIALQYHEVKINMSTRAETDLFIRRGNITTNTTAGSVDNALLLVSYIFLDTMERRMFAQQAHEYLFDQVQFTGDIAKQAATATLSQNLNFNHPIKELIWVSQRDEVLTRDVPNGFFGNDIFNWSGAPDANTQEVVTDLFDTTQIQLNGHDRTIAHPAQYYRTVQPWQHHTAIPDRNIYDYSFALYPEDVKPSGSVNASRIDNFVLRFVYNQAGEPGTNVATSNPATTDLSRDQTTRIYARSLNVIKIVSGMAGLMLTWVLVLILASKSIQQQVWRQCLLANCWSSSAIQLRC